METKNVIVNKSVEVPVILTVQKTITVPDFTEMVKTVDKRVKSEEETCGVCEINLKTASISMLEQLGIYFETLFTSLNRENFESDNFIKIITLGGLCVCRNGIGVKIYSEELLPRQIPYLPYERCGNGIVIALGTGNGAYDFTTYTRFTFLYDNNEVVVPKHFASTESFLAAFANNWSLIKQLLETTIKTKLKEYQEKYEKKTIKIQKTLKDVANFEI